MIKEAIYKLISGGWVAGASVAGTTFGYAAGLGWRITRPALADPHVATAIFTIAGGPIAITSLTAYRTIVQAGAIAGMTFAHSVGPIAFDTNAAVTTNNPVGTCYVCPMSGAEPVYVVVPAVNGAVLAGGLVGTTLRYGSLPIWYCIAGNITVNTGANIGTGSCTYTLCYIPLTSAVTVITV